MPSPPSSSSVPIGAVLREWGRIGCLGFGGPPVHVAMLRELCVDRRGWIDPQEFEDAIAATNLLPGPASTQLAIFSASRVAGVKGAIVGGLAFVLPGLVMIIGLAALFLASAPPAWVRGAGAGAGAVVAAIALQAGLSLAGPSLSRTDGLRRARWLLYAAAGALAAILAGPWLVLVLLGFGMLELAVRAVPRAPAIHGVLPWPAAIAATAVASASGLGALAWTALKVGALSYGGGFVIIPLMQHDAVERYGWMSDAQFLDAVALGQITPGPVVHTVAAVGFGAHGLTGALLAAVVAFAPSFALVLLLAGRFDRLRSNERVRAFLDGAGPAAIGAIVGVAVPLAAALSEPWQFAVLGAGAAAALTLRVAVVPLLLVAAAVGVVVAIAGGPIPA